MGGQTKILGEQKVVKSDKCNYLGARARAAPKVYAYDNTIKKKAYTKINSCTAML